MFRIVIALILASSLAACGSLDLQATKVAQVPPSLLGKQISISPERVAKDDVAGGGYEVPGRSIFFQQTSGGSLAVGLLLGPIGILANSANIARITNNMGESGLGSGLYEVDAQQEARAALDGLNASVQTQPSLQDLVLKPYITYTVMNEDVGIIPYVVLRAEAKVGVDGKDKWVGNYTYTLDGALPLIALQQKYSEQELAAFKSKVRKAYAELLAEMRVDLTAGPVPQRDVAWVLPKQGYLGGPGDVSRSSAGHLVLRNMWGTGIYNCIVFSDDTQFSYHMQPVARVAK